MRKTSKPLSMAASAAILLGAFAAAPIVSADDAAVIAEGKRLAFDRKLGNCLACHQIAGGDLPGNIGPPLIAMQARFPDRKKLYDQIYDATMRNPDSVMPPFGRHGALTAEEIDKITTFVHTL